MTDLEFLCRHLGLHVEGGRTRENCITSICRDITKELPPAEQESYLKNALELDEKPAKKTKVDVETEAGVTFHCLSRQCSCVRLIDMLLRTLKRILNFSSLQRPGHVAPVPQFTAVHF